MIRNFVTGVFWGTVAVGVGLGVVSQMVPLDRQVSVATQAPALEVPVRPAAEAVAVKDAAPKAEVPALAQPEIPAANAPEMTDPRPPAVASGDLPSLAGQPPEVDEPLLRPLAAADAPAPATVVPDMPLVLEPATQPAPEAAPVAAASQPEVAASAMPPQTDTASGADPVTGASEAQSPPDDAATQPAAAPPPGATDMALAGPELANPDLVQPGAALVDSAPADPAPAGAPLADLAPADPAPDNLPPDTPDAQGAAAPSILSPDAGLDTKTVDGVTTGRLPSISAAALPDAATAAALPDGATTDTPQTTDLPPLQRFARAFDNPAAKPLFAVLLIDPGTPEVKRSELAALPFPVTFVLDPLAPGVAEAEAIYRAAGQEVLMLATGIPTGAKASDLEQSFAALDSTLTQAVGLIDTAQAGFQNDRGLAADVVTLLADQGRGLVTFDRGLNAADQVARREGLPAAMIFRSLDDDAEDAPLIRRYLDRAAFKAAQEGAVVVIGTAREATVAALLEWAVEGRAASVALAPISAVMALR